VSLRKALLFLAIFTCGGPAVAQSNIEVSVVETRPPAAPTPVPSDIQFKRSSAGPWELLDRAEHGRKTISFACIPGTQIRADPIDGAYSNSNIAPCGTTVNLTVRRRGMAFFLPADAVQTLDREGFSVALARQERIEDGNIEVVSESDRLIGNYLTGSASLSSEQRERAEIAILNDASSYFTQLDSDKDGRITKLEVSADLAAPRD